MLFFTDYQTKINQYLLCNIKAYPQKIRKYHKLIFIDPSVYELKNSIEYSNIDYMLNLLDNQVLDKTEFISIDYPSDMNLNYEAQFIEKSIALNLKYKNHPNYIHTIQFKFKDYKDFNYQFDYLKSQIDFSSKIVGIGNLCRILGAKNKFVKQITQKLCIEAKNLKWLHLYGLGMRLIKTMINPIQKANPNLIISVDSTKFTRAVNNNLKHRMGVCCRKSNRNLYFLEYMKQIKKYKIPVFY